LAGSFEPQSSKKIGRQIVLPIHKAIEIAWKSMKIRLWRSVITTSGIVLAIAFLMSVWTSGAVTSELQNVPEEANPSKYRAIQRALQERAMTRGGVSIRTGILGSREAASAAVFIRDALQGQQLFRTTLLPTGKDALRRALRKKAEDQDNMDAVVVTELPPNLEAAQMASALRQFARRGGTVVVVGAQNANLVPASATSHAFEASGENIEFSRLSAVADIHWKEHPPAEYSGTEIRDTGRKVAHVGGKTVLWMGELETGIVFWLPVQGNPTPGREMLEWITEGRLLPSCLRYGSREKFEGGTYATRSIWLLSLSFLVCFVGITNAMFMSVTERFREIGTMKCLGALDSFVVRLFLIESSFQGALGATMGALVGLLLAFVRALFSYHASDPVTDESYWLALDYFPWMKVLLWLVIAIGAGVILSVIAAILPALRAARMEPVEALRSEA
jgi:hypothetical protein